MVISDWGCGACEHRAPLTAFYWQKDPDDNFWDYICPVCGTEDNADLKIPRLDLNGVPFYVAMPTSTLDPTLADGSAIPIEERSAREVTHVSGRAADGSLVEVQLVPDGTVAANPAFDVTPARLVSGLITEHGVVAANAAALRDLWLLNAKENP